MPELQFGELGSTEGEEAKGGEMMKKEKRIRGPRMRRFFVVGGDDVLKFLTAKIQMTAANAVQSTKSNAWIARGARW